jgi:hypothetical protein
MSEHYHAPVWILELHFRARGICGNLSCTSMHFQALSCNGRLPKVENSDTWLRQSALIMPGSRVRPSLSTNQIRVMAMGAEIA